MPKQRGNIKANRPPTMAELTAGLAESVKKKDPRYEFFYNYAFPPAAIPFFKSPKKTKVLAGANRCIAGSSMVYDPVAGYERRVDAIKGDFHVLAWAGDKFVPAIAGTPFIKDYQMMYRVQLSNGGEVLCTANHLLLTRSGAYQPLSALSVGDSLYPVPSISDICLSVLGANARNSQRTAQDFQFGCQSDHRCGDARPLSDRGSDQDASPSRSGAPSHTCDCCNGSDHDGCDSRLNAGSQGGQVGIIHSTRPDEDAFPLSIADEDRHSEGRSCYSKSSQSSCRCVESSYVTPLVDRKSKPATCLHQATPEFHLSDFVSPSSYSTRPLDTSLRFNLTNLDASIITSIDPVRQELVWDFEVPQYHNYYMGGMIHHNSRKTSYAIIEAVMIYTGIVPEELKGVYAHERELLDISPGGKHHRPRLVRIVVMDFTKHWPTVIRRMLLGDPSKNEVGLLPEAWSNWNEKEHLFEGPDGSILDIFAADPSQQKVDTRNLRGASVDHTMIDEINTEGVYTESLVRGSQLNDGPRTVTCAYCPQEGYDCWHYDLFYKAAYDPVTKKPLPLERQNPSIYYQQISMRDNPMISEEQIQHLINSMRPWEVAYRVHGEYSYRGENPYFQIETLVKWEANTTAGKTYLVDEVEADPDSGEFKGRLSAIDPSLTMKGAKYDEEKYPVWRVWEEPKDDHKYILSADVSAGHPESDYQAASVWDATDRENFYQVAQLRMKLLKPGDFGQQCACMANIYGNCLVAPESNGPGEAFIDRIRYYDNLYMRAKDYNKREERETETYGFSTDVSTKGPMLEMLYKHIQAAENAGKPFIKSRFTIMELQGYEERIKRNLKNEAVREWGARSGSHDDTVMETAIACRIIRLEYGKISTCKLENEDIKSYPDNHNLTKTAPQTRAFSKMRPQRSYFERQKKFRMR